jgi:hypothetical protein
MRYAVSSLSWKNVFWTLQQRSFNGVFLWDLAIAALLTLAVYVACRMQWIRLGSIAGYFSISSRGRAIAVLAAMLLPVGFRVAFLPWVPVPQPHFQDEFSHLLVADTLANGRLANPPHPLWRHLDTMYVLQHPAYASIYPIGQGLMMASGKVLAGSPWLGVLLVTALMGGAICWALLGCLPVPWAAAGGLLAAFTYGTRWMDSYTYWGGQFCALGGALLFGALVRLYKSPSNKSPSKLLALVAALGWSITWLVRPFESATLFLLMWGVLAFLVFRRPWQWKQWLAPIAFVVAVQAGAGLVTVTHNLAVTGSPTTLPYQAYQKAFGVPQTFAWQAPLRASQFGFPELRSLYQWQLDRKQLSFLYRATSSVHTVWDFFVTPWYSIPLLLTVFLFKDGWVRAGWGIVLALLAASLLYPFFFAYYIAAISCVVAFLIARGFMALWHWSSPDKPASQWVAVLLLLGGLLTQPLSFLQSQVLTPDSLTRGVNSRGYVSEKLMSMGGRHAVFVRYGPHHIFDDEWVYNGANIDASPIVWCRWMGPAEDGEVMQYYGDRQFWIVDVDGGGVAARLSHYEEQLNRAREQAVFRSFPVAR